jgi:hypothetical protein
MVAISKSLAYVHVEQDGGKKQMRNEGRKVESPTHLENIIARLLQRIDPPPQRPRERHDSTPKDGGCDRIRKIGDQFAQSTGTWMVPQRGLKIILSSMLVTISGERHGTVGVE